MASAPDEQQYMAGYSAGLATCLQSGSSDAGRRWLADVAHTTNAAYVAGYEWAIWDYEDANGLGAHRDRHREAN